MHPTKVLELCWLKMMMMEKNTLWPYYSYELLPREPKYSTVEKECQTIKMLKHPLLQSLPARQTICDSNPLISDHRTLQWLD